MTALHFACREGRTEIVQLLVKSSNDFSIVLNPRDDEGRTALPCGNSRTKIVFQNPKRRKKLFCLLPYFAKLHISAKALKKRRRADLLRPVGIQHRGPPPAHPRVQPVLSLDWLIGHQYLNANLTIWVTLSKNYQKLHPRMVVETITCRLFSIIAEWLKES